ncbi:hypothetical protein ACFLXV_03500 [Chloroflexota bacterium]
MLEIRKTAVSLEEPELIGLEQIIADADGQAALVFLRKFVYNKVARSQGAKLKSHLDTGGDPVKRFKTGL